MAENLATKEIFHKHQGSDGICPTQPGMILGMKLGFWDWMKQSNERVLACFGGAQLIKSLDGRLELRGGSSQDRLAAKEWMSLFCHEALPVDRPTLRQS